MAFNDTQNQGVASKWIAQGPGPTLNGQVENVEPYNEVVGEPDNEVVGAIHTVIAHPTNPDILYVGGTNGGIWRTQNATASRPIWEPLTDNQPGNSIGALTFDPTDPTSQTIIAGIGRFSSFGSRQDGGPLTGLLQTTDGGNSFTQISDPLLTGRNFSGVAKRGNLILASANDFGGGIGGGLYRSTDNGSSWTYVSGTNGLAEGAAFDLVSDPSNLDRFYVSVQGEGVFRSDDGGTTWVNISANDTAGLNNAIVNLDDNNNTEMSVASNGRLYVAVLNSGQASYIGYSDDQGANWTAMDLPRTQESNNEIEGLNPRQKPGTQGYIHFSIQADPNNPNIVYVGGDRQDSPFPNFIGALDFSGRLFRGDTIVTSTNEVPSPQWEHLTHRNDIAAIPEGGTARSSAPHADSREIAFDANGNLIEVDDGGIYRRTNPQNNTGDWFSIIGNLQTTEFHDIAYDTVSNIIIGGAQDTGTPQQFAPGSRTWDSVSTGDGGDVAVDNTSQPGFSIRYSSNQNLGGFRRLTYDANGDRVRVENPSRTPINGSDPLQPIFVTPVELNKIDPTRLLLGGSNGVYESLDQGDTITRIGPGVSQNAMVYGGRSGGVDNEDVLYYGSDSSVFLRTTAGTQVTETAFNTTFGSGTVRDIILDSNEWRSAFVIDEDDVFQTTDTGTTWNNITGNLRQFAGGLELNLRTIEFISSPDLQGLVVGTNFGVFSSVGNDFTDWLELGTDLPNVPVWDLDYDEADNLLVAGTLGRGAWTLPDISTLITVGITNLGTSNDDNLTGTSRNDTLKGFNAQDILNGLAGDDHLDGGDGDDKLYGGEGKDTILGGSGQDLLFGEAGNDHIDGGDGDDKLYGGEGNDYLLGGQGQDQLFGEAGDDILDGGTGDNTLTGGAGRDIFVLSTQGKNNIVDFEDGQDLLRLTDGLSFGSLSIFEENGGTRIATIDNQPLALLTHVNPNLISASDFITV